MRYHETPEFKRLSREWNRILRDDGFQDLETLGPEGPLNHHEREREARPLPLPPERAREALWEPKVWKGLPPRARRLWGYVVLAGFSPRRAAETLRVSRWRAYAWVVTIKERVGIR